MDPFLGIDIASQDYVSFSEECQYKKWKNNAKSIRAHLKSLPEGTIVALESTGGYGKLLANMAVSAGFTVYMVQPAKVKRYRESAPDVRGKTDRIDARAICDYVKTYLKRLHPYQPLPPFEEQLRKLSRTRDALVRKLASIRTQLRSLGDTSKQIETIVGGIKKRIAQMDEQIKALIASAPDAKVLLSIPCVKTNVIATVLPALRTIPFKDKYALDSYAGMDLRPRDSGKLKGVRHMSKEGDRYIRRTLYLAAMAGIRARAWKAHFEKLTKDKKLKKIQAINALARKILHTIFGVYRAQKKFELTPEVDKKP